MYYKSDYIKVADERELICHSVKVTSIIGSHPVTRVREGVIASNRPEEWGGEF